MKKNLFFFLLILIFISCKKYDFVSVKSSEVIISELSQKFANDEIFAATVANILTEHKVATEYLHKIGGQELLQEYSSLSAKESLTYFENKYSLNSEVIIDAKVKIISNWAYLMEINPEFAMLDINSKIKVLEGVRKILSGNSHVIKSNTVVKSLTNAIAGSRNTVDNVALDGGLSWNDIGDCAFDVLAASLASQYKLIKTLYDVIHGYNLGLDGIRNVCYSALKSIIGSTAGGAAFFFVTCIIRAYLF